MRERERERERRRRRRETDSVMVYVLYVLLLLRVCVCVCVCVLSGWCCVYIVHFKNTHAVAAAIKGKTLVEAQKYLEAVMAGKRCIPFRKFCGGVGRTAQAKNEGSTTGQGRWPKKSCEHVLGLLKNAESNAEVKGLDTEALVVKHIQVNRSQQYRRRTFRAHGRINAYRSSPCHVEMILAEKEAEIAKEDDGSGKKLSRRAEAKRMRSGASN